MRRDYLGGGTEFMDGSVYRPSQGPLSSCLCGCHEVVGSSSGDNGSMVAWTSLVALAARLFVIGGALRRLHLHDLLQAAQRGKRDLVARCGGLSCRAARNLALQA